LKSERRDSSRRLRRKEAEGKIARYRAEQRGSKKKKGKTERHYKHTWKMQRANAADNNKRREDNCRRDRQQRGFKWGQ